MSTPLSRVINFGPVTLAEFEAMGLTTLEQLEALGWEEVCRKWVESFPERLNANAFVGVLASLEGVSWMKATPSQRAAVRRLVQQLKRELGR